MGESSSPKLRTSAIGGAARLRSRTATAQTVAAATPSAADDDDVVAAS
jgi:hypothetical protein